MPARVTMGEGWRGMDELLRPDANVAKDVAKRIDWRFRQEMKAQFDSEGSTPGPAWRGLSPGYKRSKDRFFAGAVAETSRIGRARTGRNLSKRTISKILGAENKILQLTGDMKRAYTSERDPGHVARGYIKGRSGIVVVLGAQGRPYFRYHEDGAGRLPRRPVLDGGKRLTADAKKDFQDRAIEAMRPHVEARIRALARRDALRRSR